MVSNETEAVFPAGDPRDSAGVRAGRSECGIALPKIRHFTNNNCWSRLYWNWIVQRGMLMWRDLLVSLLFGIVLTAEWAGIAWLLGQTFILSPGFLAATFTVFFLILASEAVDDQV
jgi:hypothetical protein